MKKSALALILAVLMAVGLLTIGAAADGTKLPDAVDGVITLTEDVKLSSAYQVTSDIIIDLNGHTLTTVDTGFSSGVLLNVMENGKLTVRDSAGNGAVIVNEHYPDKEDGQAVYKTLICVQVRADGEFVLESGTIKNTNPEFKATQTISNYGTTTIKGGTVEGVTCIFSFAPSVGGVEGWNGKVATVSIVGGEIKGTPCTETTGTNPAYKGASYGVCTYGPGLKDGNVDNAKSIINISGGTITAAQGIGTNASSGQYAGYTLNMTGGTVDGTKDGTGMYLPAIGVNNISGGTITGAQAIRICAGELNITDGTIIGTEAYDDDTDLVNGGSGGTAGAIVVGKAGASGYVGSIDVNISGSAKIKNSADNGAAIVVSDKNMAADAYTDLGISVDITGGTVVGDVRKVSNLSNTPTSDGGNTTLTLDGASVKGDVINSTSDGSVLVKNSNIDGEIKDDSTSGSIAVISSFANGVTGNNVAVFDSTIAGQGMNEVGSAKATINGALYDSLQAAINAAKDGDTITLLKEELNSKNETFAITKDITITGEKMTVERTVAGVAFEIKNGGKLTFDNLKLEINGDPDSCGKEGDAVTKGIDVYDGELVITNNSKVDFNNLRSAIVMQTAESSANIVSSRVTASNVWGNFSNGGDWHIIGSSLNIGGNEGSKGHGLSATELEIRDSSVNINSCGLLGLTAKRLDVDDSTITVNECGKQLPYASEWSTDKESYKYPVEIKNGGSVTIDKDSTITLMNNPASNVLYLVNSTLTADGTLNASIRTNSGSEFYIVSIEGSNPMVVASGDTVKLPTVSKPGYIFLGWKCSDGHTYQPDDVIKVEKNMTFTAIWANMPDITPGTPGGDDDDEPVVTFPFNDVSVLDWFYDAVYYVWENELMNGTDVNQFSPNSPLTRAMVWAVLARVDGETISGDSWMTEAQAWAVESGVSDGTDPTGYVTREQLVTMLYRFAGEPADAADISGYPDAASISDWAADAMAWAVKVGLIEGDDVGALNPTANSTRAHAATFFMRFSEL